jgi:hypothetical protein
MKIDLPLHLQQPAARAIDLCLDLLYPDQNLSGVEPGHNLARRDNISFVFVKGCNSSINLGADGNDVGLDAGIVRRDKSEGSPPPDPQKNR